MTDVEVTLNNQTNLMLDHITKANMWLDTAELIGIGDVRARCIAQATEAEDRVRHWLRDSGCGDVDAAEVENDLEGLSDRLAMQTFYEERHSQTE